MNADENPGKRALFRYGRVSEVLLLKQQGTSLSDAVKEVTKQEHYGWDGRIKTVSRRSLYRWVAAFKDKGIAGLRDEARQTSRDSAALDPKFIKYLVTEKRQDPKASIPEVIRRAVEDNVLASAGSVSRSTVLRAARRLNLPIYRKKERGKNDMRRFAKKHRMRLVIADGKHFRAGEGRLKRVAIHFMDDASRFGLHVVVGYSENQELVLRGLMEVVVRYGRAIVLYVDGGSGFDNHDITRVCSNIKTALVHGRPRYPQARAKIERFHSTLIDDVLRGIDGNAAIDPDPKALEALLLHNLHKSYNRRPHSGIGNVAPEQRFFSDEVPLVFYKDRSEIERHFTIQERRRVSADNIISVDGRWLEMPLGYATTIVTIHRRTIDGACWFDHHDQLMELKPVDLQANADAKRARPAAAEAETSPPETAAMKRFKKDHKPVVDKDGNLIIDKE